MLITLLVIAGFVIFGVILYNRLVALRENRKNAFADIEVQLKQRHDLIPNLIETVKGYMEHEKELLENITQARTQAMGANGVNDKIAAEGVLGRMIGSFFAVAENYPDLKADTNFLELQRELSDIENKIAAARRFFNNATNEYNTAIQQVPSNFIAQFAGFAKELFFELDEEEKKLAETPPKVSFE